MDIQIYPILLIGLSILMLFRLTKSKPIGVLRGILFLAALGMLVGGLGLLKEKIWAAKLSNISLIILVLGILLPPLAKMLGIAIFTQSFYEGMEDDEKEKRKKD